MIQQFLRNSKVEVQWYWFIIYSHFVCALCNGNLVQSNGFGLNAVSHSYSNLYACLVIHLQFSFLNYKNIYFGYWKHISVGKGTCCYVRVPGFHPEHPCGSSQSTVTPIPGNQNPLPLLAYLNSRASMWRIDVCGT